MDQKIVIIGAGPAGLGAAYELAKHGTRCIVLERDNTVGGISRTVDYNGYKFDIGGHRFFTKSSEVNQFWEDVLGDTFLRVRRLSRIYFNNRFFYYPLRPMNALLGLGAWNSTLIVGSYVKQRLFPYKDERTFEQWVSNRFGKRLYSIFFKTYTEKVWGIPCSQIGSEWAAQRIKGLSLTSAVKSALFPSKNKIKTLIDEFRYPREGPGMLYAKVVEDLARVGTETLVNWEAFLVTHEDNRRVVKVSARNRTTGAVREFPADRVISTMPLTDLVAALEPQAPDEVLRHNAQLRYRDFLVVNLIVRKQNVFPDNWIYIHSPQVLVGRMQNYKNWSPYMVKDGQNTSLGLEYFCNEGDAIWSRSDSQLVELAADELRRLRLIRNEEILDGFVVRMPKTYCLHDTEYPAHLNVVRRYLDNFTNLQPAGRAGMFKYNNQDHSIMTGFLSARNILGSNYDVWAVNVDSEYLEGKAETAEIDQ
jgi:protoporphyrinogen oxidase